jgi:hypothetical protein
LDEDYTMEQLSLQVLQKQVAEQERILQEQDLMIQKLTSTNGIEEEGEKIVPFESAEMTVQQNSNIIAKLKHQMIQVQLQRQQEQLQPEKQKKKQSSRSTGTPSKVLEESKNAIYDEQVQSLKRIIIELKNQLIAEKIRVENNVRAYMRASVRSVNATLQKKE